MHIDFLRVTDKSFVNVGIIVEFINEDKCNGIKFGGVLNVVRSQVELRCPATSIPEKIIVDLEGLNVGDTIHISSITLPENCTPTITDRDFTVATVAAPRGGMSENEDEVTEEKSEEENVEEKAEDKKKKNSNFFFMKLLVGLGNTGSKFLLNRHNIGFIIIDKF